MTFDRGKIQISGAALRRMPGYLLYLKSRRGEGEQYISSTVMANDLKQNPVQIRKDLSVVSNRPGKPKLGFEISALIEDLEEFLGYNGMRKAVVVGAGGLGKTLLSYEGFEAYGLKLVAGFDVREEVIGKSYGGKPVFGLDRLNAIVEDMDVSIGVITVPKSSAQEVADLMVQSGIKAIWNFAPTLITIPEGIEVKNENLAASLALLSKRLEETRS